MLLAQVRRDPQHDSLFHHGGAGGTSGSNSVTNATIRHFLEISFQVAKATIESDLDHETGFDVAKPKVLWIE